LSVDVSEIQVGFAAIDILNISLNSTIRQETGLFSIFFHQICYQQVFRLASLHSCSDEQVKYGRLNKKKRKEM
jgi:hypothetical protein